MSESYAALLRLAPARRLVYALTAACLSFGMVSLTILLLVERETGSYPAGGLGAAAFALLAGVSAPFPGCRSLPSGTPSSSSCSTSSPAASTLPPGC